MNGAARSDAPAFARRVPRQGEARQLSVLIVEDDAEIGELVSMYLASQDIAAQLATNGAEKDERFRRLRQKIEDDPKKLTLIQTVR